MKSILLIVPYFGKWPIWFEAHLISIGKNPTINWLIVTDCEIPENYPLNIKFVSTSLQELNQKVNQVVEANVTLTPRKFCDLKPTYRAVFEEYSKGYDFWGFCDIDIIWGDIRKFITDDILNNHDVISSRKEAISGHFNLFRNDVELNFLFKQVTDYQKMFENSKLTRFDETVLTNFILNSIKNKVFNYRIYWSKILLNQEKGIDSRQEYYLDRWQWENGKIVNMMTKQEVMYLHFINWKKNMKSCEVEFKNEVNSFYISHSSIHIQPHTNLQVKWNDFRNIFDGYYVRIWKKNKKNEIKKYKKRIMKYLKMTK